jgi:hypothetical protein
MLFLTQLVSELILINELLIEHESTWCEGSFHIIDNKLFWKNLHLDAYFALQPPNYLVEEYVTYRYGMLKKK